MGLLYFSLAISSCFSKGEVPLWDFLYALGPMYLCACAFILWHISSSVADIKKNFGGGGGGGGGGGEGEAKFGNGKECVCAG